MVGIGIAVVWLLVATLAIVAIAAMAVVWRVRDRPRESLAVISERRTGGELRRVRTVRVDSPEYLERRREFLRDWIVAVAPLALERGRVIALNRSDNTLLGIHAPAGIFSGVRVEVWDHETQVVDGSDRRLARPRRSNGDGR